jgi:hypothetical protein
LAEVEEQEAIEQMLLESPPEEEIVQKLHLLPNLEQLIPSP